MDGNTEIRARIVSVLKDFSDGPGGTLDGLSMHRFQPSREAFPVPELVLFILRDVMGFRFYGTGEKVRWTVSCAFQGYPCIFELRKFGFSAAIVGDEQRLQAALGALRKGIRSAEPLLRQYADQQSALGNVTLVNRFHAFDRRYRYFREKAANRLLDS